MTQRSIPLQPNEEIKPIIGYEGLYSITSFGRVWSHKRKRKFGNRWRVCGNKFIKVSLNERIGYSQVILCKNGKQKTYKVHRLVAIHFISNSYNLPEVNHKDTIKTNNYKNNLEWSIHQDNMNHAARNKLFGYKYLSDYYGVSFDKRSKRNKPWIAYIKINKKQTHIGYFKTEIEAAKAYDNFVIKHNLNRPLNIL